jgi:tRNA-specific 2-thiouridylase
LFRSTQEANDLHWIAGRPPPIPCACQARIRYRQATQSVTVFRLDADTAGLRFDIPQRAVTPGQAVVFYSDDQCLGGGTIR